MERRQLTDREKQEISAKLTRLLRKMQFGKIYNVSVDNPYVTSFLADAGTIIRWKDDIFNEDVGSYFLDIRMYICNEIWKMVKK